MIEKLKLDFRFIFFTFLFILIFLIVQAIEITKSKASSSIPHYYWGFTGLFGSYDKAAVQRGYDVYRQSCASCHSIQAMRYADLQQIGLSLEQIDKIAKKDRILDGKNAQGHDNYRPATITDFFVKPYMNDDMAKAANNGQLPIDFSRYMLIRQDAADYGMALLMGYRSFPKNFHFDQNATYYNIYVQHQQIGMKLPLIKDAVHLEDGTVATVEQQARDVITFLSWIAHPHLTERHRIGIMLSLYMIFIITLLYLVNRKVWSNVKK